MFLLLLYGMALAAFLDFAIGMSIVHTAGHLFGKNLSPAGYFIGGILALSPDVDLLYMALRERRLYGDHHQNLTHRPVLIIPLAGVAGFLIGGPFWGIAASLCLFWHFIHDTEGLGGPGASGMAWFWPFSKKYISPKGMTNPERALAAKWKDRAEEWMYMIWLRPSRLAVSELALGTLLFMYATNDILGWRISIFLMFAFWLTTIAVWKHMTRYRHSP